MTAAKKLKEKTCAVKGCENTYIQYDSLKTWCSPECGTVLAMQKVEQKREKDRMLAKKLRRAENAKFKKKVRENDKKYVHKQAVAYFHRWIKWRDQGLPCCACGNPMDHLSERAKQASHYRPSGMNAAIRFHEDNVHLGCSRCNMELSGNLLEYRERLIEKIGIEQVEWLHTQNQVKTWTIEELREIRDEYGGRLKALGIPLPTVSH